MKSFLSILLIGLLAFTIGISPPAKGQGNGLPNYGIVQTVFDNDFADVDFIAVSSNVQFNISNFETIDYSTLIVTPNYTQANKFTDHYWYRQSYNFGHNSTHYTSPDIGSNNGLYDFIQLE